jgi:CheY-like chemotaxis protein
LITNVKRLLDRTTNAGAIEIVDEVSTDVPDILIGDPGRLRRVIARFVESVTARSSANRIRLVAEETERNTTTVTLRFTIAPLGERSTPLDRESASNSVPDATVGLGLPVVLETLSRMGGRVVVDSNARETLGIRFTIRLQMRNETATKLGLPTQHITIDRPVLVIADAISDRRELVRILSDAGIPRVVAASVDDWIANRESSIDNPEIPALALIDSTIDSFAEADRFSRRAPASIPMVIVAASGQRGDAARCRHHGVGGYLAKPIDPSDLVDVVNSTIALAESGDRTTLVTRFWIRDGRPSLRVLVVDDSQTNRFLMTRMLEERGHSTTTASDGSEALEMLERAEFDVVLMDVMMPGMDGLEATRLICERRADPADGPLVIGVSAFTDESSRDRAEDAGMSAFLAKPIRPDDLYAAVEQQVQEETPAAN